MDFSRFILCHMIFTIHRYSFRLRATHCHMDCDDLNWLSLSRCSLSLYFAILNYQLDVYYIHEIFHMCIARSSLNLLCIDLSAYMQTHLSHCGCYT